jgi:hypothetical protein
MRLNKSALRLDKAAAYGQPQAGASASPILGGHRKRGRR